MTLNAHIFSCELAFHCRLFTHDFLFNYIQYTSIIKKSEIQE